jgi:hypothetical protein
VGQGGDGDVAGGGRTWPALGQEKNGENVDLVDLGAWWWGPPVDSGPCEGWARAREWRQGRDNRPDADDFYVTGLDLNYQGGDGRSELDDTALSVV